MVDLTKPHVGLFLSNLSGGGVQKVILNLAKGLYLEGIEVDLIVGWPQGINQKFIPEGVNLVGLNKKNILACVPGLINYLRNRHPLALVTAQTHVNLVGIICRFLSGRRIRLIVCEHNNMKEVVRMNPGEWFRPVLARFLYPFANVIVAVSKGVANGLTEMTGIRPERINVIYNPLISDELLARAEEPVAHPWFQNGPANLVLSVGRLEEQKDFPTLIQAVQVLNKEHPVRLLILGEGSQRVILQELIDRLGLHDQVDMPGYKENPYSFMKHSSLFVLSSKYEGFPSVLVEAMACGVPVISTNCPSGPSEILDEGNFGRLVPVGNITEMAKAIMTTLGDPINPESSIKRGLEFNFNNAIKAYMQVIFPN